MGSKARIMCYLNQFFVGIGGEEKADVPLGSLEGAHGPGRRLQELLGDAAEIVVTAFCGDNYFNDHGEDVVKEILKIARAFDVEIVVAGPAFGSGRYAYACVEVCHAVSASLDLPGITGISLDNPALQGYTRYKDRKVFAFPTRTSVAGMKEALPRMAQGVLKLVAGSAPGPAFEEGYIPRGIRVFERATESGAKRAIDMLLDKVAGRPFSTEITVEVPEQVPVAPPIADLTTAHLAMVTSSGLTLVGNPYKFKVMANSQWKKYPIDKLSSLSDAAWDVIHGGINTAPLYKNANYGAPLDICREMEQEGVFSRLASDLYGTTGFAGAVAPMQAIGREMAAEMKSQGVNGVLLVST
jgi:betaine reductase